MAQNFRYYAPPEEIKSYLEAKGYQTEIVYSREQKAIGFAVVETGVRLRVSLLVKERVVGYELISLWYDPYQQDADKEKRSKTLYQDLRHRFGKPSQGNHTSIRETRYLFMDSDVVVAYYGIQLDVPAVASEVEQLEYGNHPYLKAATRVGLDFWWSGFPNHDETSCTVLIGRQLAIIGGGNAMEVKISTEDLLAAIEAVPEKLSQAGFPAEPKLLLKVDSE